MKTIYLKKSPANNGLLVILTDLKDDSLPTVDAKYPGVIQGMRNIIEESKSTLPDEMFFATIAPYHDLVDDWLFYYIYISAPREGHQRLIEISVSEKLEKLFRRLGYGVSSNTPD